MGTMAYSRISLCHLRAYLPGVGSSTQNSLFFVHHRSFQSPTWLAPSWRLAAATVARFQKGPLPCGQTPPTALHLSISVQMETPPNQFPAVSQPASYKALAGSSTTM